MAVSNDLLAKFAKMSKESKIQRESTVYGITVEYGGKLYVKMDGSDLLTPVVTTSEIKAGERVTVMVKDHTATITGNISNPSASTGTTDGIRVDLNAVVTDFGNFKELVADKATVGELNAEIAKIGELVAIKADIVDLDAARADISKLYAKDAEIDKALITKAEIVDLEAAHADISILEADMAEIQTLVGGNLTMDNIQSLVLTASKVSVDNAFIKDAMVDRLSADKINAGTLNTNLVTIGSEDGSMTLNGSLQQFKDANGNVRIQIGKDTSGDFTFVLYGEDGTGQLINQNGITASAIGDGIIVNDMVADNANISGSKLDINSVIKTINEDGSETINSSKIYLDDVGQSLDVAFDQLKTSNDGVLEQVQTNTTNLEVAQGQINALISNSSITKEDGTIVNIKDELNSISNTVNSHSQTISSLETTYDSLTGEIEEVTSATSKVEQDLDSYKILVQNTYLTRGVGDVLFDEINTRIDSVEQEITPVGIMSKVESTDTWIQTNTTAKSAYSQSIQNADKIGWFIASGTDSSSMTLTEDALTIIADNIDLTGKVTFNSFSEDVMIEIGEGIQETINSTEIDGANIKTGTIKADKIGAQEITSQHIATGSITAEQIAAGTITADKIAAGVLTTPVIEAGSITSEHLASGAVTTEDLAASAVTADKIAAGVITGDHIQAGSIYADNLSSYCISSTHIQSGAITSDKITSYAITSEHIASGSIQAKHITAGSITASKIATATITADQIAGNTITAAEIASGAINTSELAAGAVTASKIAAGAIEAEHISAGAISVDKLSSNNSNPVITLFDQCELDASYLNGQGKGNAIRLKWDDYNYIYIGTNMFAVFQTSGGESKIFSVTSDGYSNTYLNNVNNYTLTLGDSLSYRGSTVLTAGNYTSYCAKSSHSHSGYASSSHEHDYISYSSSYGVESYSGYNYFRCGSCTIRQDNGASGYGWNYKLAPTNTGIDLGNSGDWQRWRYLYIQSIDQSSDIRYKENIMYLDDIVTYDVSDTESTPFLDFIKNDFRPALYDYKIAREEEGRTLNDSQLGFIANDIYDTEVGQTFLYNHGTDEETNLSFSTTGYTTVVARALQEEIKVRDDQIAMLESMIANLEERLSALENNNNINEVDNNGNES